LKTIAGGSSKEERGDVRKTDQGVGANPARQLFELWGGGV